MSKDEEEEEYFSVECSTCGKMFYNLGDYDLLIDLIKHYKLEHFLER